MNAGERSQPAEGEVLHFGGVRLDTCRASVTRDGTPVRLRPKAYELLVQFARSPGQVLSKAQLLGRVWPGLVVTDDSLTQCVNELRSALGDREHHLIKTVPRRGYLLDAEVTRSIEPGEATEHAGPVALPGSSRRKGLPWAIGLALAAATTAGSVAVWHRGDAPAGGIESELRQRRSVAVLPMTDLSDPKAPHIAEGVTDDLITDIGRMPNTLVIARSSVQTLGRGTGVDVDVREVGRRLGVRHVLTGSVSGDGQRVQVTAQLSRADTGAVLWTERFLYAGPRQWNWRMDISRRVAATLNVKLHEAALGSVARGPSGEGIDRWLQGQYLFKAMKSREQMVAAREHFAAAVQAEPRSVNALSVLALTHVCLVLYRWSDDRAADIAAAKVLARRALEIQPDHPIALRAMGQALQFAGEFEEAQRTFERMIAVSPSDPDAHRGMASVLYMSAQWERVTQHAEQALELSPLDPANRWRAHTVMAGSMLALRRDDEALAHARLAVEADPNVPHLHFSLAAIQGLRGELSKARESLDRGLALHPDYSVSKARATAVSAHPAYVEQMLARQQEGLRLAGLREQAPSSSTARR